MLSRSSRASAEGTSTTRTHASAGGNRPNIGDLARTVTPGEAREILHGSRSALRIGDDDGEEVPGVDPEVAQHHPDVLPGLHAVRPRRGSSWGRDSMGPSALLC